jgi:hypothetical protein
VARPEVRRYTHGDFGRHSPSDNLCSESDSVRKELALERAKQTHEIRQTYLKHVLENDRQTERVLKFLVKVEEDPNLKAWAADELKNFQKRIKTKNELYRACRRMPLEVIRASIPSGCLSLRPL